LSILFLSINIMITFLSALAKTSATRKYSWLPHLILIFYVYLGARFWSICQSLWGVLANKRSKASSSTVS
jgi:hypothetical protein